MIVYDNKFNANEWFVILLLASSLFVMFRLKKRFPYKQVILYFMYSFFIGMVLDHTISVPPFDFYDVNDKSSYQFMDFLTYLMYGPFGYIYVYLYDYLKVKSSYTPFYILFWAIVAISIEYIASRLGVYHYKNGYKIYYSFPIYFLTLTPNLYLYKLFNSNKLESTNDTKNKNTPS